MKVLKNNFNNSTTTHETAINQYPKDFECERCSSELQYEESDVKTGEYGIAYVKCPLCGYENYMDDEPDVILTKDNITFPAHFHHTSVENGAVNTCDNAHIKDWINKAIKYFRENKDEYYWMSATGNTCIFVLRHEGDDDYNVIVTGDYYETYIPFEKADKPYKFI